MAHVKKSGKSSDIDQAEDHEVENSSIENNIDARDAEDAPVEPTSDLEEVDQDGADESACPAENLELDSQGEVSFEEMVTLLEAAREEISNFKDLALRAEAEAQNIRKRARRDVENAHRFGLERFLTSLLPVIDSLEKAIESAHQAEEQNEAVVEGVDICLKMLLELLQKENIQQIDPEGEPFDPQYHEAMSTMENPDVEANTVVKVFQKGYLLHGRLVRAAMVIVSKAPEDSA